MLFLSPALPASDLSGHGRALRDWAVGDRDPVEDSAGWIGPGA